jgi:hypothetical protein
MNNYENETPAELKYYSTKEPVVPKKINCLCLISESEEQIKKSLELLSSYATITNKKEFYDVCNEIKTLVTKHLIEPKELHRRSYYESISELMEVAKTQHLRPPPTKENLKTSPYELNTGNVNKTFFHTDFSKRTAGSKETIKKKK